MRWEQGRRSENVEDRRGMPVRRGTLVQGGIGTIIFVLVVSYFLGIDPTPLLQGVAVDSTGGVENTAEPAPVPEPGAKRWANQ